MRTVALVEKSHHGRLGNTGRRESDAALKRRRERRDAQRGIDLVLLQSAEEKGEEVGVRGIADAERLAMWHAAWVCGNGQGFTGYCSIFPLFAGCMGPLLGPLVPRQTVPRDSSKALLHDSGKGSERRRTRWSLVVLQ